MKLRRDKQNLGRGHLQFACRMPLPRGQIAEVATTALRLNDKRQEADRAPAIFSWHFDLLGPEIGQTEKRLIVPWASSRRGRQRSVLSLHPAEAAAEIALAESASSRLQRMVSILHLEASTSTGEPEKPEERATERRRPERMKGSPDLATRQSSTLNDMIST